MFVVILGEFGFGGDLFMIVVYDCDCVSSFGGGDFDSCDRGVGCDSWGV